MKSVTFSKGSTKGSTRPGVFSSFFKLYKWYQIAQRNTYLRAKQTQRKIRNSMWNTTIFNFVNS